MVAVCSLCCVIFMLLLLLGERYGPQERELQKGVLVYFVLFTGIFITRLCYKWYPEVFVAFAPLFYACHTYAGMVSYHIVFRLTSRGRDKRFPPAHYVIPGALPVAMFVWMLFVPFEVPLGIAERFGRPDPDWLGFSRFFATFVPVEIVFTSVYLVFSFVRLRRYRRTLPRSRKDSPSYNLRWFNAMIVLICFTCIHPVMALLMSKETLYSADWFITLSGFTVAAIELILLYNLMRHNYPPLDIKTRMRRRQVFAREEETAAAEGKKPLKEFSRKDFDDYFRREKPYLDPALKLTSLAEALGAGREELSRFVNRTYGVNFNVFVGRWRLKELEKLQKMAANRNSTLKSLLPQAGFGNYHSYMRTRPPAGREVPAADRQKHDQP